MNESLNPAWDSADTANHALIERDEATTHNWVLPNLSLPEDCLWDEYGD